MTLQLPTPHFRPLPLYARLISLVLIIGCLFLGLIGLVLPVIPGLLFLFIAALLLTRVSRRASIIAHNQPWFRKHLAAWRDSANLSWWQRTKLSFLIVARAVAGAIRASFVFLQDIRALKSFRRS